MAKPNSEQQVRVETTIMPVSTFDTSQNKSVKSDKSVKQDVICKWIGPGNLFLSGKLVRPGMIAVLSASEASEYKASIEIE